MLCVFTTENNRYLDYMWLIFANKTSFMLNQRFPYGIDVKTSDNKSYNKYDTNLVEKL